MERSIFYIILLAFISILVLNVIYRFKILKLYKYLLQNDVKFNSSHFFNTTKLENEIIPRYPTHEREIRKFITMIRHSVTMASLLLFVIIIFGYILIKSK